MQSSSSVQLISQVFYEACSFFRLRHLKDLHAIADTNRRGEGFDRSIVVVVFPDVIENEIRRKLTHSGFGFAQAPANSRRAMPTLRQGHGVMKKLALLSWIA